jgi:hypothetical protein
MDNSIGGDPVMALTKPPPVHQKSSLSLSGGKATTTSVRDCV